MKINNPNPDVYLNAVQGCDWKTPTGLELALRYAARALVIAERRGSVQEQKRALSNIRDIVHRESRLA